MKAIREIYSQYNIMPILQQHQLRVAAVAKKVCESVAIPIDAKGVIKACLLHDMGNIIKFDLNYFPGAVQPEGLEYWQKVKDEYIQKYGPEEDVATEKICEELGLSNVEKNYLSTIGFSRTKKALATDSLEQKICCYADMRVGPHGVISIEERLIDGRRRYEGRKDKVIGSDQFEEFANALRQLEKQIFTYVPIVPEAISDALIESEITPLADTKI